MVPGPVHLFSPRFPFAGSPDPLTSSTPSDFLWRRHYSTKSFAVWALDGCPLRGHRRSNLPNGLRPNPHERSAFTTPKSHASSFVHRPAARPREDLAFCKRTFANLQNESMSSFVSLFYVGGIIGEILLCFYIQRYFTKINARCQITPFISQLELILIRHGFIIAQPCWI